MKYFYSILLIFGSFLSAFSCGNEYGFSLDGRMIHTEYFYLADRMEKFDIPAIKSKLAELTKKVKSNPDDYKSWSDIAVNLLKIGNSDSAIKILRPWVQKLPNEYNLNANLGTAYELTGKLDSALKYISKGYALNDQSHSGSEWIHIKILEAKIKDKKQPGWLQLNRILDVEDLKLRQKSQTRLLGKDEVGEDIMYQIRTRVPFTPAPNRTITNLLLSLGDYNKEVGTYENALLAYIYALQFEPVPYAKYGINTKIAKLNQQRDLQTNAGKLPEFFISMMKRSKLDPELVLMGIDNYAMHLDSLHLSDIHMEDSLRMLKVQLDSLSLIQSGTTDVKADKPIVNLKIIITLCVGILIGFIGMMVFRRRKA
jgi:tetratricopeptide (TPR) repeat protein